MGDEWAVYFFELNGEIMIVVGPLVFHWYGLMIGLGVILGGWVAVRKAELVSLKREDFWDGVMWAVAFGVVGARLYHVVDLWDYYWLHPGEIVMLWHGGMGIFGGILGGLIGLWWWAKDKKKWLKMIDLMAIGMPLGQAIGRWGNYFNQELYGLPTDLPWGIFIKPENRLVKVIDFDRFHPLFLYESLWNLMIFGLIYFWVSKNKVKLGKGRVAAMYLVGYSLGRFFLEFLRIESWAVKGVNVAQGVSVAMVLLGLAYCRKVDK